MEEYLEEYLKDTFSIYNSMKELIDSEADYDDYYDFYQNIAREEKYRNMTFYKYFENCYDHLTLVIDNKFVFINDYSEFFEHQTKVMELIREEISQYVDM